MSFELEPPTQPQSSKLKPKKGKEYIKSYLSNAQAIDQAIARLKEVALLLELEPGHWKASEKSWSPQIYAATTDRGLKEMQLLLVKATFKPNNPVCEGFIIASVPYTPNVESVRTTFQELAVQLGFYNPDPEQLLPLAELPSELLHQDYLLNWAAPNVDVVAYANGEY